jgi:DNA-directed RNA polymerase specialized sigma subunit
MMKAERLRDKYPLLKAFGEHHVFLDAPDEAKSDVNTRIQSIWPFMVRRVIRFYKSLKPREKANCDIEDLLLELCAMLIENDKHWDIGRGRYITFAGKLIAHELLAVRDRSRTVHSPRNASSRIKEYKASAEEGTLSERRRETFEQLSRTIDNIKAMPNTDLGLHYEDDRLEDVDQRDLDANAKKLLAKAIKRLPPAESLVVGWSSGLWGSGYCTHEEIAKKLQRDVEEVREMKAAAYAKIRWYINARRKQAETAK